MIRILRKVWVKRNCPTFKHYYSHYYIGWKNLKDGYVELTYVQKSYPSDIDKEIVFSEMRELQLEAFCSGASVWYEFEGSGLKEGYGQYLLRLRWSQLNN